MIGDRLKQLRLAAGMDQVQFAAIAKTTKQYVSQLESGRNKNPKAEFIRLWAAHFGVRMEWITSGKGRREAGADDDDYSHVTGYAQAIGLGDPTEAQEYVETHKYKFRTTSLRKKGLHARRLHVFKGKGESMLPRIQPGDAVLFDESDVDPKDSKLYAILASGNGKPEYQVKRALVLGGIVYFQADNPSGGHGWSRPRAKDDRKNPITVIGRVRWIGSWED